MPDTLVTRRVLIPGAPGGGGGSLVDGSVTNVKLATMATARIKGRATAGTGAPEDLTATQVRTLINVADGATANSSDATLLARANHTGTQAIDTVSGLQAALDGKEAVGVAAALIAALVDSAPGTLDTLNELAAALGDDPNAITTLTALIGTKLATADKASQAEAEAGTENTKYMTALRVAQAIEANQQEPPGPLEISYTTAIPFDRDYNIMEEHIIDGATTFTVNTTGRVLGGGTYLLLTANGIHAPNLDAFTVTGSYDNTEGRRHEILFLWNGTDSRATINQLDIVEIPDVIAPTVLSMVATGENTIVVTFSEAVAGTDDGWAFDQGGALVISGVTGSGTDEWTFTITEDMVAEDAITADYAPGDVEDLADTPNALASITGYDVTNDIVAGGLVAIDLSNNNGSWTESPAGTWTGVASGEAAAGTVSATGDCIFQWEVGTTSEHQGIVHGLDQTSAIETAWGSFDVGLYAYGGAVYTHADVDTGDTVVAGNLLRLVRTGTAIVGERSTNGGGSWTQIHDFGSGFSATLYPKIACAAAGTKILNPMGEGFA